MIAIIKKNFLLTNKITNYKKIFSIITQKIPRSIFTLLDSDLLDKIIKDKLIEILEIKKKNKVIELMVHPYIESKDLYKIYNSDYERVFLQKCFEEYEIIKSGDIFNSDNFKKIDYNFFNN